MAAAPAGMARPFEDETRAPPIQAELLALGQVGGPGDQWLTGATFATDRVTYTGARGFRRALRRSIEEELLRVRLDTAKRLLTATHLPIAEVAAQSGFAQPRYLSVWFRGALRSTPSDYRRRFTVV